MKIVGVSGSIRRQSSNAALLRAAARVAPEGVEVVLYDGLAGLPHFDPAWNVVAAASRTEPFVGRKIAGELTDPASLDVLASAVRV